MKKRLVSFLLCLVMLCGLLPAAVSAADSNPFWDVPKDAWYWQDVTTAYTDKLINGKTATTFAPNDNLTYAEAVKLAACMHQKYRDGMVTLANGDPWYQSYVDYCKKNSIISGDYTWNDPATRAGYMSIFANALPNLSAINTVKDNGIPDVQKGHPQYDAIYKLYRAGILQGVDSAHNCNPSGNIKRSEVAAILTRMMYLDKRIAFSIGEAAKDAKLAVTVTPDKYTDKNNSMTFKATATGGKPNYSYQWAWKNDDSKSWTPFSDFKLDCEFSGASTDTLKLKLTDAQRAKHLVIFCVVTDAAGGIAPSNEVAISSNSAEELKLVKQPKTAITADDGSVVTVAVEVTGGEKPYTFKWQSLSQGEWQDLKEGQDTDIAVSGAVSTLSLWISALDWTTNEDLRCVIVDADGNSVKTDAFRISTKTAEALKIAEQPKSKVSAKAGETKSIYFKVSGGTPPYAYRLEDDGQGWGVTGGVGAELNEQRTGEVAVDFTLQGANVWPSNVNFRVKVTDAKGNTVTTNEWFVEFIEETAALKFTAQTSGKFSTKEGYQDDLSVTVTGGTKPYTFRWQSKSQGQWEDISDAENAYVYGNDGTSTLTMRMGKYLWTANEDIRCVVTDAKGNTITSDTMRFVVEDTASQLAFSSQSGGQYLTEDGEQEKLYVTVTGGTAPYTFQWQSYSQGYWQNLSADSTVYFESSGSTSTMYLRIGAYDWTTNEDICCIVTDANGTTITSNIMRFVIN